MADPCAQPARTAPATCKSNGFVGLDLAGTWTFTGTRYLGGPATSYTAPFTIEWSGETGWCKLTRYFGTFSGSTYVDHTFAMSSYTINTNHGGSGGWRLCVDTSDGMLHYTESENYFMGGMQIFQGYDGVLTR